MSYINDVLYVVPGCIHLFNDASVRLKFSLEGLKGPRKSVPPALTALTSWVHTQGNLPPGAYADIVWVAILAHTVTFSAVCSSRDDLISVCYYSDMDMRM